MESYSLSLDLIVAQELGCFVVPHGTNESMGTFIDQVPRQEEIVNLDKVCSKRRRYAPLLVKFEVCG